MSGFYLIGYSGHAFVVAESALKAGYQILGYMEKNEKTLNPYHFKFAGSEDEIRNKTELLNERFFVGIGDNAVREKIFKKLAGKNFINIMDPGALISVTAGLGTGVYIGKNCCVNALAKIGEGAIINTGAIVEHECEIGNFTHIAPGAVICGNVKIGNRSFVGAGSTVRQGIKIGNNVTIGAGSVVVKDIPDNTIAFGNPAQIKPC